MKKLTKKKQNKYFVSLCLKIPANFEVEVLAENEKDAFEKTLGMFECGDQNATISEPFWEESELDIGGRGGINSPGVHIEEIE